MTERKPGSPPVEPLSDIAWQRVERGLFAALDCDATVAPAAPPPHRRGWAPWALTGSFAAAAMIMLVLLIGREPGSSSPPDGGSATASRVVTQDAASQVSFGDAAITVGAQSALTMHGDARRGVLIVLERGSAIFEVAPRAGRPPFVVEAGEVSVRVVGTRFTVTRIGDTARVDVADGVVEVVARGDRVQVHAGESWPVVAAAVAPQPPTEDAVEIDPMPPPVNQPSRSRTRPRETTTQDDRARFEHAAALEASDPRAALREYRALKRGKGPWAANALYAAGRLAAELGDRKGAIALLREYLVRFAEGGNAANARALLDSL